MPAHAGLGGWIKKAAKATVNAVSNAVSSAADFVSDTASDALGSWASFVFKRSLSDIWRTPFGRDFYRDFYHVTRFPARIKRLLQSIRQPFSAMFYLRILEVAGTVEIYQEYANLHHPLSRLLTESERAFARTVFGETVNLNMVRITAVSPIVCFTNRPYTSTYYINTCGDLRDSTLAHELTHVWQYEQDGIAYAYDAISEQIEEGNRAYEYGGFLVLQDRINRGRLTEFKREQQGKIVEDFVLLREYYRACAARPSYEHRYLPVPSYDNLVVYAYFVAQASTLSIPELIGERHCSGNNTNENFDSDPDNDNACYGGGTWAGQCQTDWQWQAGWYLIRVERGSLRYDQVPEQYRGSMPGAPAAPPPLTLPPPIIPTPTPYIIAI
jgi:hypothetical protein